MMAVERATILGVEGTPTGWALSSCWGVLGWGSRYVFGEENSDGRCVVLAVSRVIDSPAKIIRHCVWLYYRFERDGNVLDILVTPP